MTRARERSGGSNRQGAEHAKPEPGEDARWLRLGALGVLAVIFSASCSRAHDDSAASPQITHELAHVAPVPVARVGRPRPAQLAHVTIKALGMYCEESCPMRVGYALADLPAVYELGFDLSHESIFISYDAALGPPKQVTRPMIAAIKQAGFDPWLAKEAWPADAKAQVVQR